MRTSLPKTFRFLRQSQNSAAMNLLVCGLDSEHIPTRDAALRTLLDLADPQGHREVLRRLPTFDASARPIVAERSERLVRAIESVLTSKDPALSAISFRVCLDYQVFEAIPALVKAVAQFEPRIQTALVATIEKLVGLLYDELCQSQNRGSYDSLRMRSVGALESSLVAFHDLGHGELIEAYLMLVNPRNGHLLRLLRSPEMAAHPPLVDILTQSQVSGVMRLLLALQEGEQVPKVVQQIVGTRRDTEFLSLLLARCEDQRRRAVRDAIQRIDTLAWAAPEDPVWRALEPADQARAVEFLVNCGISPTQKLSCLVFLLKHGKLEGRRAAAEAIAAYEDPMATRAVVCGLEDDDPMVRAHLLKQLRPRQVPNAMSLLMGMVGDRHSAMREALHEALPEFTVVQFLLNFESIPHALRATAGQMVRLVDVDPTSILTAELAHPSPRRRQHALQATAAMGLTKSLEAEVLPQLQDDDPDVRLAGARALAQCDTLPTWDALRDSLLDRSHRVRQAAESSLTQIATTLSQRQPVQEEEPVRT